ncbi:hypothetical protein [Shimia sp.]|uniref:hypothetical protein n=1 Tax=Shimia sp. TaxID=1954381 RepID=UPI003BA95C85
MAIIDLPQSLSDRRSNENFWLHGQTVSAGVGLDGREQIMFAENRIWRGKLDLAHLFGGDILAARSVGTRLRGRANLLRLTFCNVGTVRYLGDLARFYAEANVRAEDVARGYIPFSDGAAFGDGSGFALPENDEPTAVVDAPKDASEIQIGGYIGRNATVGARFSINDFLYEVESNDSGEITFSPPLREAVSAGTLVKFSEPTFLVRLEADRGWEPFTQYGRLNRPMSVDVVEAFDR